MLSHVRLFATPWTVACQALPSMEFSGKNTGVGSHSLLPGIFPTQGSKPGLLHCREMLYHNKLNSKPWRKLSFIYSFNKCLQPVFTVVKYIRNDN